MFAFQYESTVPTSRQYAGPPSLFRNGYAYATLVLMLSGTMSRPKSCAESGFSASAIRLAYRYAVENM